MKCWSGIRTITTVWQMFDCQKSTLGFLTLFCTTSEQSFEVLLNSFEQNNELTKMNLVCKSNAKTTNSPLYPVWTRANRKITTRWCSFPATAAWHGYLQSSTNLLVKYVAPSSSPLFYVLQLPWSLVGCDVFLSFSVLQVDMTDYPFDIQKCSLRFGSWSYDTKRLDLHFLDGFEVRWRDVRVHTRWKMVHVKSHDFSRPLVEKKVTDLNRKLFQCVNSLLPRLGHVREPLWWNTVSLLHSQKDVDSLGRATPTAHQCARWM